MAYGFRHPIQELIAYSVSGNDHLDPEVMEEVTRLQHGISIQSLTMTLPDGDVNADLRISFKPNGDNDNNVHKLRPEEYFQLVQALVCRGEAYRKKTGIHAFDMLPLDIVTQNSAEGMETRNRVNLNKVLVFDAAHYSHDEANSIVQFIFSSYGHMVSSTGLIAEDFVEAIDNGDLELHCEVKGYGIWTITPRNFKNDYQYSKEDKLHVVKEGTTRFCLNVDREFVMPVLGGEFNFRKYGTIAARTEDLPQIIAALEDVQAKRKTIQEAFYTSDGRSLFDIYGMDPHFHDDNYDQTPQTIAKDVQAVVDSYRLVHGRLTL